MTNFTSIQSYIIQNYIDTEFESQKIKASAREFGYDIEANFVQYEFTDLNKQFFEKIIVPIESYLKTPEAQLIDNYAPSLNAREIFYPIIEKRLKETCKIIPGGWNAYPIPEGPSKLWTWITSWWNNTPSSPT